MLIYLGKANNYIHWNMIFTLNFYTKIIPCTTFEPNLLPDKPWVTLQLYLNMVLKFQTSFFNWAPGGPSEYFKAVTDETKVRRQLSFKMSSDRTAGVGWRLSQEGNHVRGEVHNGKVWRNKLGEQPLTQLKIWVPLKSLLLRILYSGSLQAHLVKLFWSEPTI